MSDIPLKIGAAYIRVSDERQDEYSPDSQLKTVRVDAAKDGYEIPDEYVFYDDGISGRTAKKRGDFNRMIAMAKGKNPPFDRIYVWKFSRFARNQEESIVYKNLLSKNGVTVKSVSENIPDDPFGKLIERIIEWMDEFYSINLSTEVRRGMTEKASRGEPICAPPYGYIMRDGQYFPDYESGAVEIVREIFQRYADGEGARAIVMDLRARGIKTQNGTLFDMRRVDYILHNHCYIGKIRWSTDGSKAVSKRQYDNENILIVDGHHEPIISMELWEAVQKRIAMMKKAYPKHARKEQPVPYMLKGLVRCSNCGGTLAFNGVKSGKDKVMSLQCCNYSRGSCKVSHSIKLTKLNDAFIEGLESVMGTQQFTIVCPPPTKSAEEQVNYDRLIAAEERRLERAKEAYLNEIDTLEQYAQNKKQLLAKIEELRAKKAEASTNDVDTDAYGEKVLGVVDFIRRADVTEMAKNVALHSIINKIVYNKTESTLDIFFHDI